MIYIALLGRLQCLRWRELAEHSQSCGLWKCKRIIQFLLYETYFSKNCRVKGKIVTAKILLYNTGLYDNYNEPI